MPALRSAIGLVLIAVSVFASSAFAADPPRPIPAAPAAPARPAPAGYWDDRFDMVPDERWGGLAEYVVNDAVIFNGELYVAGRFSDGNTTDAAYVLNTIARWDGRKWTRVAQWPTFSYSTMIYAMVVHDNSLYVAGTFSAAGGVPAANIARWDGASWHALGSGLSGAANRVFSLASWNGDLYAGGSFSSAGGAPAANVARWDGATWHAVGEGLSDDSNGGVTALGLKATPFGLYAGGVFNRSGSREMQALARWDGAQWSAAVPGLTGLTFSLDWHAGQLYAGGRFAMADAPEQTHNTLRWDGAQAQLLTAGANPQTLVRMVRSVDGELYAGITNTLYRWENGAWQPFGPPLKPDVTSPIPVVGMDLIAYNGRLHLFGAMEPADTTMQAKYALALDGDEWLSLGQGVLARAPESPVGNFLTPMVSGVAVIDGDFYVAADSVKAGGRLTGNVARWDGAAWSSASVGPAGFFPNFRVTALLAAGSTLYAAGYGYDQELGRDINFIARRDGGAWTTLANTINGRVDALAWSNGVLYAGGRFTAFGLTIAPGVARWDGASWSAMGTSPFSSVRALAASGGTVYAAGWADGGNAVARWSNGAWSSIATAEAYALEVGPDNALYAGGRFTSIGGVQASLIARWSNGAWAALGGGITAQGSDGAVYGLDFAPDGALYVGGRFSQAGGVAVSNIARYDGQWSALGGALTTFTGEGIVRDLEATAQGVYAGGHIVFADGRYSESVAIWRPGAAPQAAPDAATTERGQAVDIAVLANDTDADQDALTIASLTTPTQGSVQIIGGSVRYTPDAGYVGGDSFGYTISDGRGGSATTMVTVTVSPPLSRIFVPLLVR
ncbi:MAG TPA: cadherin-like domain-containing protein [Herpetosiphonaceae bacterium]|nr:cadherin-like domain-containing protein [Herpetosiphonaceae bacterium]